MDYYAPVFAAFLVGAHMVVKLLSEKPQQKLDAVPLHLHTETHTQG